MEYKRKLRNGVEMPYLGFGTWKLKDDQCADMVQYALENGYDAIDTAQVYLNEEAVGEGIWRSGKKREEIFVTTKVRNRFQGYDSTLYAVEASLKRLGMEYLDLYLIHWPVPGCYTQTWKALEKIQASGRCRSIGVSNFEEPHLQMLFEMSGVVPAVNQIECHPLWNRKPLVTYCQQHNIAVQAYAPLARGLYLNREIILQLSEKYGKTPAQIGLRYLVQRGICVIPKSTNPDRISENADIFNFTLSDLDMDLIDSMDEQFRSASIPEDMIGQGVH